jgi:hypothetical protein
VSPAITAVPTPPMTSRAVPSASAALLRSRVGGCGSVPTDFLSWGSEVAPEVDAPAEDPMSDAVALCGETIFGTLTRLCSVLGASGR